MPPQAIDTIHWQANVYTSPPVTSGIRKINSMYYVHAQELRRVPTLRKSASLNFEGMMSWLDVGLAVLHRIGWGPECSKSSRGNLGRVQSQPVNHRSGEEEQRRDSGEMEHPPNSRSADGGRRLCNCSLLATRRGGTAMPWIRSRKASSGYGR